MAIVPENNIDRLEIENGEYKDNTYFVDFEKNTVDGVCDGFVALRQAIYKILNTQRYEFAIYDREYGIETKDLIGKDKIYVAAVIKGRIEDALLYDDRIERLSNFKINSKRDSIEVCFDVESNVGNGKIEKSFVI